MRINKTLAGMILVFLVFFSIGARGGPSVSRAVFLNQTTLQPPDEVDQAIRTAFQEAVNQYNNQILGFLVYEVLIDHIEYAQDRSTALLWLAMMDPETGEIIATEPGLSIAQSSNPTALSDPAGWTFTMQPDANWLEKLKALPEELLTEDIRNRFLETSIEQSVTTALPLTGYKLPWTAGVAKRVTNSIGHVYSVAGGLTSCPATCRYAYDFADGTMFPLLAAKGGTVKSFKYTCPNYDTNCTNYLILEDQSTIPTTYQVYYHMAYNSIPERLRKVGAPVLQGEYIGDADDTGASTGHHLHFHVFVTPNASNWSWGSSVDFKFDDVSTNGGYPRTCAEASAYPNLGAQCQSGNKYISGNTPAHPPSATLTTPPDRMIVTGRTVRVEGSASDDIQIARIQVLANYDGTWKTIDDIPPAMGPFAKEVDLCAAGVPDGPFALTVRVYDREGSLAPGLPVRQLIKNSNCAADHQPLPVPACQPGDNQVALYAEPDYRGVCRTFDVNMSAGYTVDQLGALGDNNAASIRVGKNVQAILYDRSTDVTAVRVGGRVETFEKNDASLGDNLIGNDTVSGLWVKYRTVPPDEPFINAFGNQLSGASPTSQDSLVIAWEGGEGATSFEVKLSGPNGSKTYTVTGRTSLSVGSLPPGNYTLSVKAINSAGSNTTTKTFTVSAASLPSASARPTPYNENFEAGAGGWTGTGLWRHAAINVGGTATTAWYFNDGADYSSSTWRAGDLTSPPITLPASGVQYLRFSYFADVEDGNPYWDQRRVQISTGGPFEDLYQLEDDKQIGQIWLKSAPISLAKYAGKTIRLRFHFDTIDEDRNTFKGWAIDDVSITSQPPDTSCADNHNSPESAQPIALGGSVSGVICPEGDIDYYSFTAKAGQALVVDVNARSLPNPSKLDAYLFLLDSDRRSVIAENDDEQYGVLQDPLLLYTIQRDGTYYLKLKAWNYPGAASPQHVYQLGINQNAILPPREMRISYPPANRLAPAVPFDIVVDAVDQDGGAVAQVDFYWHGPDWSKPEWVLLGSDTNGGDGWSYRVDPNQYGGTYGSAVYAQARGKLGGVLGAVIWDLIPDQSSPLSQLKPLPAQTNSTAIRLEWTANDAQNDIDRFEVQYQVNNGGGWSAWQNWNERLPGNLRTAWFIGQPAYSYRFRMRAVDRAGNAEAYPEAAEAVTAIAATCTPDFSEAQGQTLEAAVPLNYSVASSLFNLCSATPPGAGDVDWVVISAQKGQKLRFMLSPVGGGAALNVRLYDSQKQPLASWQSPGYGSGLSMHWTAPATGAYYLEIKPIRGDLFGTDTYYQIWYGQGSEVYLPKVMLQ